MSARRRRPDDLWDLFPGDNDYSVRFSIVSACTDARTDPSQYTETIHGDVLKVAEGGSEEPIGRFEGYRLRRDWAEEEGESFWDIADAFSSETHGYLLEVFTEDGDVRPDVEEALGGEPLWGPVLMAHTLEIVPTHRGQGLGYAVIDSFIETFEPGAGLVIAHAAPIDPPDLPPTAMDTPEYRQQRARSVRKLRRYWKAFGFVSVSPVSEYLALNLAVARPSLAQVIRAQRSRKRSAAGKRRDPTNTDPINGGTR